MKPLKIFLILGFCAILGTMGYFGNRVHDLSDRQRSLTEDYATINSITFGLFSVNEWKDRISTIANKQIQNFDLTKAQKKDLKKEVEQVMNALITKAIGIINRPQKTLIGKIKKAAVKIFVNEKELRAQVPGFANTIVVQLEKPSSKKRLKKLVSGKLKELEKTTFDSSITAERQVRDKLYSKYHVKDGESFNQKLTYILDSNKRESAKCMYFMLGGALLILIIWLSIRKHAELHKPLFALSIAAAAILLVVGISSTMLVVEAQIKLLDFSLLGEDLIFKNQVLFFQSKGILEVVTVLLQTGHGESVVVGVLILCFSVLFPVSKLSCSLIYLFGKKYKWMRSGIIHYFAFDSGKWSMADVMVVAIMMTFLAFNGILDSQLAVLNIKTSYLTTVTTNDTALASGFTVFVSFVMFSLLMSEILHRFVLPLEEQGKHDEEQSEM